MVAARNALMRSQMKAANAFQTIGPSVSSRSSPLHPVASLSSCLTPPALQRQCTRLREKSFWQTCLPLQRSSLSPYESYNSTIVSKCLPRQLHLQAPIQHQSPKPFLCSDWLTKRSEGTGDLAACRSVSNDGANGVDSQVPSSCEPASPPFSSQAIDWPSPHVDAELAALEPLDCIFVLAGGQTSDGGVPLWVQRRLDAAHMAYVAQGRTCPIVVMGGGTPHRPPVLNKEGYVIHEGTSCAAYLVQKYGMDPDHILKEWSSYDTIANGYFALVTHAIPRCWRRIMMVTSAFHFERSRLIFEWVFGLHGAGMALRAELALNETGKNESNGSDEARKDRQNGAASGERSEEEAERAHSASISPAENRSSGSGSFGIPIGDESRPRSESAVRTPEGQGFSMHYLRASDEGVDADVIQARLRKEAGSIRNLRENLIPRIRTLPEMHRWLHIEHKAYNVADQGAFGEDPAKNKDPAIASY